MKGFLKTKKMCAAAWIVVGLLAVVVVFQNCDSGFRSSDSGANDLGSVPPPVCQSHATLTWAAPTKNSDGTDLTDLTGYKVSYGTKSKEYTVSTDIGLPTENSYKIENLTPGVYYFVMQAYNSKTVESGYSNEAVLNLGTCGASGTIDFSKEKPIVYVQKTRD